MDDRYEVKVTGHAEASMREIAQYIAFELLAPEAAVRRLCGSGHRGVFFRSEKKAGEAGMGEKRPYQAVDMVWSVHPRRHIRCFG